MRIKTSSALGSGSGRSASLKTSGPPGAEISTQRIFIGGIKGDIIG
jgi:hypothetical protein